MCFFFRRGRRGQIRRRKFESSSWQTGQRLIFFPPCSLLLLLVCYLRPSSIRSNVVTTTATPTTTTSLSQLNFKFRSLIIRRMDFFLISVLNFSIVSCSYCIWIVTHFCCCCYCFINYCLMSGLLMEWFLCLSLFHFFIFFSSSVTHSSLLFILRGKSRGFGATWFVWLFGIKLSICSIYFSHLVIALHLVGCSVSLSINIVIKK